LFAPRIAGLLSLACHMFLIPTTTERTRWRNEYATLACAESPGVVRPDRASAPKITPEPLPEFTVVMRRSRGDPDGSPDAGVGGV